MDSMANNWRSSFQSGIGALTKNVQGIDISGVSKQFGQYQQQFRESTGVGGATDVTELPEEYLQLERRVDALRAAHTSLLKITKAYQHETYDYPTQADEAIGEFGGKVGHSISFWALAATAGTNLPQPKVLDKPVEQHKTLSHALSRAAASGAVDLQNSGSADKFSEALQAYSVAQDRVGNYRLEQDEAIQKDFLTSWSALVNNQIPAAMKARANVKSSRLALDSARARQAGMGNQTGPKVEQVRLEVEAAEEGLVNAVEEAITRMRAVLENPESLTSLAALVKAQQAYHAKAAEALAAIQTDLEETATNAEAEYRKSRA